MTILKEKNMRLILFLSFIVVGLLLVVLSIATKAGVNTSGKLRAGIERCVPRRLTVSISGGDEVTYSRTPEQVATDRQVQRLRAQAAQDIKTKFCRAQQQLASNLRELDCLSKNTNRATSCRAKQAPPVCTAIVEVSAPTITPDPSFNGNSLITFQGIIREGKGKLTNDCIPQETPTPYPRCTPSGTLADNCDPKAAGTIKTISTATATVSNADNRLSAHDVYRRAIAEAKALAADKLDESCQTANATFAPRALIGCYEQNKECAPGCRREGNSMYLPPARLILESCIGEVTEFEWIEGSISIVKWAKAVATCDGECDLVQACARMRPY